MAYNTLQSQSFTRVALSTTKRMRTVVTTSAELYDKTRMLTKLVSRKVDPINVPTQRISQASVLLMTFSYNLFNLFNLFKWCTCPPLPLRKSPATFSLQQALREGVTFNYPQRAGPTLRRIAYVVQYHVMYQRTPCLVCVQRNGSKRKTPSNIGVNCKICSVNFDPVLKQVRE